MPIDRVKSVDGKTLSKQTAQMASKQAKKDVRSASGNQNAKMMKSSLDKQRISQNQSAVVNSVDEASPMKNIASLDKKLISHLMPVPTQLANSLSTSNIQ